MRRYITTSGLDESAALNAAAGLAQGEFLLSSMKPASFRQSLSTQSPKRFIPGLRTSSTQMKTLSIRRAAIAVPYSSRIGRRIC